MSDYWEYMNGLDPSKPDSEEDPDHDGCPTYVSMERTLPLNNDTDSDMHA